MTTSRDDDFDRGLKNRREVLGEDWVTRSTAGANSFNADFQAFITRYAWHDVWGRPGLDRQTRRLLVLAMTMGLARWEEFELHCRAAVRGGVPLEAIKETLMQGAIYCGVPAANTAFKITQEILKAEHVTLEPAPLVAGRRVQVHHTFSQPQLRVALQGAEHGVPIVMSHALGLDLGMWDELADTLGEHHPVLRYDQRGHGGSAPQREPATLDEMVDDVARLVREWGRGPVVFIGLSMGGMVGQGFAIRHPELVRGLVLANTTARYPDEAQLGWTQRIATVQQQGMAGIVDTVVERYLSEDMRQREPAFAQALRERLLRCDPAGYVACCHAVRAVDWLDGLSSIKVPALVIAGGRDTGTPPEMNRAIAERIAGAQLQLLEHAAHLSVAEAPERFADAVRGLLKRAA
ncbi:bifunctional 4-carboxymuconolactone decarboxylase/3-oxoadipate enol-lactonase PcaCD [Ideonella sp. BN130291]|uniref:bifunctional 4-carboxymuconolactone decarboxylase/3-oxoadipate enol-lactonase PcaCD n=1 Tax=Ideonella sp. BN130291 TaxID=3112940 RepID=UPI002E253920|nr:alpha/beta fold hydrolase [Ideonella sp. BN130291]